jgi:casein kinase II subunit alpha
MLIDLGLADFYKPNLPYNVRVASRHYKAPELLLGYQGYDFSLDIWGFGCILAGLLFYKEPFFRGRDNVDQLATIVHVLGTADLHRYMITYSIPMTQDIRRVIAEYKIQGGTGYAKDWREFIQNENVQKGSFSSSPSASLSRGLRPRPPPPPPSPEGIDLLSKILRYNHKERLSAREAMAHAYFDPVRMTVERQLYNQNQN